MEITDKELINLGLEGIKKLQNDRKLYNSLYWRLFKLYFGNPEYLISLHN